MSTTKRPVEQTVTVDSTICVCDSCGQEAPAVTHHIGGQIIPPAGWLRLSAQSDLTSTRWPKPVSEADFCSYRCLMAFAEQRAALA